MAGGSTIQIQAFGRRGKQSPLVVPPGTEKIIAKGKKPFQIEKIKATITFKSRSGLKATAVDLYGYPRSGPAAKATGQTVTLLEDTYYTITQ